MSTTNLNLYVVKNAKGLNSFDTLCSTMFGSKKGKFNQKVQLTHLREMSIYMSAVTSMEEAIFSAITLYLKDLGDSDTERKLFRTAMYLLSEAIAEYSSRNELTKKRGAVLVLNSLLGKELGIKGGSTKQLLIWRTMGSIVHAHNAQATQANSTVTKLPARNTEIETFVTTRLHSTFEGLQYPVKQKKSVMFGEDKEFFPKILLWSSVLSALARCEEVLPKKGWHNLSCGLTCTHYTPLVQHSFRVLWNTARLITDDSLQLSFMTTLLADRDGTHGKEQLNVADVLCCTYLIRTLSALARNCADLQRVDPTSQNNPCSETLRILMNLFVRSLRFLQSKHVKIVTEMVTALLDRDYGTKLLCMIAQITNQQKVARSARPKVVALVTEALIAHMQAVDNIEAVNLPPLLRACETLGRFLVHRPYFSPRQQQKDGDTIAGLWTTLRRHYRACLMPKDDFTGSDAQRAGRALEWRQLRAQAGSNGGGGYYGRNCWSWPAESPSVATAATSHNPHILAALLCAQIWMAPDQRYCPKEHALLWSAFSESLLSSWQLIVSTLSSSFDILDMLMPLLTQYFARVQASLLVGPAAATAVKAAKTGDANFMDFSELPSGASEAVVEIAVHYQPVYVDVLIALTEQLVTATRSSVAVAFLQDVWKWLATFTSSRAHPQQAVVQAKKDLAVQNATAIPVSSEDVEPPKIATVTHEIHANMVLLQSIARMTVVAQQHHLHTASVPVILGTSSPEDAAKAMHNLHSAGLWHLADNALLCISLVFESRTTETEQDASTSDNAHGLVCTSASSSAALHTVVRILAEAATQGEQPNVRNIAILGLVKVSCQLLLQSATEAEESQVLVEKEAAAHLLLFIFREFALIYLTNFGYTLSLPYRNALRELLTGLMEVPAESTRNDFVVELMSHVFALPSAIDSTSGVSALPSIFSILQSAMKMLYAQLQSKGLVVADQFRMFVTVHASLQRNNFVLLVLPPPPAEQEEEVEEGGEEVEEIATDVPVVEVGRAPAGDAASSTHQTAGHTTASSSGGGGDNFFGFDDDLLGGWSSAPVLAPSKAVKLAAPAASGGLTGGGDLWLLDMPLVPTKASTTTASTAGSNVFDIFGSSEPLFPSAAPVDAAKTITATTTTTASKVFIAPPPPVTKRTSFVQNIYDEDEATTATTTFPASTAGAASSIFSSDAFVPTPASFVASAPTLQNVFGGLPPPSQAFDWLESTSPNATASSSDPFSSSALQAPQVANPPDLSPVVVAAAAPVANAIDRRASGSGLDSWSASSSNSSNSGPSSDKFNGFAPTSSAGTSITAHSVGAPSVTSVADTVWSTSTICAPPVAKTVTPPTSAGVSGGFDSLPGFSAAPAAASTSASASVKSTESTESGRRAASGPVTTSPKENVVSSEVAAAAAARRANRRASTGASAAAAQGKSTAATADPFASSTGLLTPSNKVVESQADVWGSAVPHTSITTTGGVFDDKFIASADPFATSAMPASHVEVAPAISAAGAAGQTATWPSGPIAVPEDGWTAPADAFATTTSPGGNSDGFQASASSDFSPSTPNSAYAGGYQQQPNYGAPYDPAAYPPPASYVYPPPQPQQYEYPPQQPNNSYQYVAAPSPYPDPNYPPQAGYGAPPPPSYNYTPASYPPPAPAPAGYPQGGAYPGYAAQPAYGASPQPQAYPQYSQQQAAPPPQGGYDPAAYANYGYPAAAAPAASPSAGYYAQYGQQAPPPAGGYSPGAPAPPQVGAYPAQSYPYYPPS